MAKTEEAAPNTTPSTWQINIPGTRAGVKRDVAAAKTIPPNADQRQLDTVKKYIADEIDELDSEFNSVRVVATGELDIKSGRNVAHIEIYGFKQSL